MLCPACNALASFDPSCARCGAAARDEGRLDDWYGPYSPYSPVSPPASAAVRRSEEDGYCVHAAACPECGSAFPVVVPLWPL